MGMERIDFIWYLKKIAWLALHRLCGRRGRLPYHRDPF